MGRGEGGGVGTYHGSGAGPPFNVFFGEILFFQPGTLYRGRQWKSGSAFLTSRTSPGYAQLGQALGCAEALGYADVGYAMGVVARRSFSCGHRWGKCAHQNRRTIHPAALYSWGTGGTQPGPGARGVLVPSGQAGCSFAAQWVCFPSVRFSSCQTGRRQVSDKRVPTGMSSWRGHPQMSRTTSPDVLARATPLTSLGYADVPDVPGLRGRP